MGRRDTRAKPYQRSITTHIRSIELSETQNTAIPTLESEGIDVSDWLSILLSVHPTDPDISSITAGANVVLRPWRYKRASREGTNPGSGQWYAGVDFTVPLDGDGTTRMENTFGVWDSEKIYFQVVSVEDPGEETPTFRLEHFGIGPRYAEAPDFFESVSVSAAAATAASGGGGGDAGAEYEEVAITNTVSSGTHGGSSTGGAWNTRPLNTLDNPEGYTWISFDDANDRFTLEEGFYSIVVKAEVFAAGAHQLRLREDPAGAPVTALIGHGHHCPYFSEEASQSALLDDAISIDASTTYEIQHFIDQTVATYGLGRDTGSGEDQIYTTVRIARLGDA